MTKEVEAPKTFFVSSLRFPTAVQYYELRFIVAIIVE